MLNREVKLGTFQNGLSFLGKLEQDKWQTLDNCDIHTTIGMVQPQLAMVSESTTVNEASFSAEDPSGNIYYCSKSSGKIWKRTTAGVYSLVHTNTNGAHTGCQYFNGYLWYWTSTKVGNFDLSSTWDDSFFTGGTNFRAGSVEANNTLIIPNGRYISRVDSSNVFEVNAFTLPGQFNATDIINIGDDVLIGSYISTDVAYCKVFLWDTVSTGWTYEDEVFEIGVNCFVQLDNLYIAQCGTNGSFYYWTGSQMAYFGRISGITTALGERKSVSYNRRPLWANGTKIYSIHKEISGLKWAFCGEYTCTGTIASLEVQGQNLLASVGTGVDKRGTTYATATVETPEIQGLADKINIGYDEYPAGIGIETKINGGSYDSKTEITRELDKEVYYDGGDLDGSTTQVKLTLTPSGSNIPIVKYIRMK
jgi:hypothetical protein